MIRKKQLITKIKSVDLFQLSVDSLQQISDVIQNSMTDENTQKSGKWYNNMLQFNRDTYSEANSPIKNRIERRRLAKGRK